MEVSAVTPLVLLYLPIAAGIGTVSWHHFDKYRKRQHPLSVVAGVMPLGWLFASALVIEPHASRWRPWVLSLALLEATLGAAMVYRTRLAEKRLQKAHKRKGGR